MKRRKNLERAVILGLLLSTSIYGSAWAEESGPITDDFTNSKQNESFTVNGAGSTAIDVDGKTVNITTINSDDGDITVTNNVTGIDLNSGSVILNAAGNNIIESKVNGIVSTGNGNVSLKADSNSIIVNDVNGKAINGIEANSSDIIIESNKGDLSINLKTTSANANGISVGSTQAGGSVELKTDIGDIKIDVKTGSPDAKNGNVYGIYAIKKSEVILNSGKNIIITTESQVVEQASGGNNVSALEAYNDSFVDIDAGGFIEITSADVNATVYGLRANEGDSFIDIDSKGKNENDYGLVVNTEGKLSHAVYAQNGKVDVNAKNGGIYINSDGTETTDAIYTTATNTDSKVNLKADIGDIIVNSYNDGAKDNANYVAGIFSNAYSGYDSQTDLTGKDITITANSKNNTVYGIYAYSGRTDSINNVNLTGNNISVSSDGYNSYGIYSSFANVKLDADVNNKIISKQKYGIYSQNDSDIKLIAQNSNYMEAGNDGIRSFDSNIYFEAKQGNNIVAKDNGIFAQSYYTANYDENKIALSGTNNSIEAGISAIHADGFTTDVDLTAEANNSISAGEILTDQETQLQYGKAYAVNALSGSTVTLDAGNANDVYGAVYANGTGTDEEGNEVSTNVVLDSANNIVKSYAVITGAGDLDQDKTGVMKDAKVISALYAEEGATVNVTGENYIGTYAVSDDPDLERTVWAYKNADINIDGATTIKTDNYAKATNSKDIAIAAGTAVNLDYETVTKPVDLENRATVNINYENYSSDNSISYISGDILSAYEGLVNINAKEGSNAGIKIEGNLLAGNNGILNVDLGKGGVLIGRADDYGDAGVINNAQAGEANEHQEFYNPAFSSNIYQGGRVDLGMGAGSKWYVTGQSWITTIDTSEANGNTPEERATIDLVTEYKDKDGGDIAAHALTVYDFKGDADFLMNLSGNRADTDMLYMKHADSNYRIMLDEDITTTDINQDKEGNEYSGLRFATVGTGSNVEFTVGSYDNGGAFNVEYEVGQDVYGSAETAHENEAYNGTELNGGKPGDNMVDNFFGSDGKPVTDESANEGGISTASANGIMLMNEEVETFADEENNANKCKYQSKCRC